MKNINDNIFCSAFNSHIVDESMYQPVAGEQGKELFSRGLKWHEYVYLPAENKEKERLGRNLSFIEKIDLLFKLKQGE